MFQVQQNHNGSSEAITKGSTQMKEDLTITLQKSIVQKSPNQNVISSASNEESIKENLMKFLSERKRENQLEWNWNSSDELNVQGLSEADLHSFLLEAERRGKGIEYMNSLTVRIVG